MTMAAQINRNIPIPLIHPQFLHANSTSHTWPFSAVAELIDNAYDPDVHAKQLWIDKSVIKDQDCLIFMDNGNGMDYNTMHKMLSFGFTDKQTVKNRAPVGVYGNGFKSGSMRLGKDVIIFSRKAGTMCVGLLSQTYLEKIHEQNVQVPIVLFTDMGPTVTNTPEHAESLRDILKYSLYNSQEELVTEFDTIKRFCTNSSGTRIIIWNLHRRSSGELELDFTTDPCDIRIPDKLFKTTRGLKKRLTAGGMSVPENEISLRAYCRILYLKPSLQIILRLHNVKAQSIKNSLLQSSTADYRPACLKKPIRITFGYNPKNKEHYGLMMYHKNRLIKAYEHVPCQRAAYQKGVGVIGVLECDYLTPVHNKQDFEINEEYRNTMMNVGKKLSQYSSKFHYIDTNPTEDTLSQHDQKWIQCNDCRKKHKLPDGIDKKLSQKVVVHMNADPQFRKCDVAEELKIQKQNKHELKQNLQQKNPQQCGSGGTSADMSLPTLKRRKEAMDLCSESPKKKKAKRKRGDVNIFRQSKSPDPLFNIDSDANDDNTDDVTVKRKLTKVLYQEVLKTVKHLRDKVREMKKELKERKLDTMMDHQERKMLLNQWVNLQEDFEEIKTEYLQAVSEDCAGPSKQAIHLQQ